MVTFDEQALEGLPGSVVSMALHTLSLMDSAETSMGPEGLILGFMGTVSVLPDGTCEVFAVPTVNRNRYPRIFARDVKIDLERKRLLFQQVRTLGVDTPFFRRWFSWLGFTYMMPAPPRQEFNGRALHLWGMNGRCA